MSKPEKRKETGQEEIIDFERPRTKSIMPELEGAFNLKDALGTNIIIKDYQILTDPRNRELAIIMTNDGMKYYTYSKVVIEQLAGYIKPSLDRGYSVRVSIRKGRRAIFIAPPLKGGSGK